jgi:hypothetical protein
MDYAKPDNTGIVKYGNRAGSPLKAFDIALCCNHRGVESDSAWLNEAVGSGQQLRTVPVA